jgi:hypothetical protein
MEGSLVAYKVFTNGSVLQASEVNDNLMNQAVITFTNSAARASAITSPIEGMLTYLADTDAYEFWNGSAWTTLVSEPGAWTAFTPTWTGLTVGNGVYNQAHYSLSGKTATLAIDFSLGSTSAMTGDLVLEVPSAVARKNTFSTGLYYAFYFDTGTGNFPGISFSSTANSARFILRSPITRSGTNPVLLDNQGTSATTPFTWASTDRITFGATYEVA